MSLEAWTLVAKRRAGSIARKAILLRISDSVTLDGENGPAVWLPSKDDADRIECDWDEFLKELDGLVKDRIIVQATCRMRNKVGFRLNKEAIEKLPIIGG